MDMIGDVPQVIRILADMDGHARWKGVVSNFDTGHKAVELLVTMNENDGIISIATRPPMSGATWSPPLELHRS